MKSLNALCPVHKTNEEVSLFWEFVFGNEPYSLYKCDKCDLIFYNPFPVINYKIHTDSITSLQNYVHLNSNIDGLIYNLLDHIPIDPCTSMMEVGCGFGFTIDFAKEMLGMEVVGYEPSLYGEVGSRELGLNIIRAYLTKEDVKYKKFDLIYLSEVLEHIEDPVPFIRLLKEGLTSTGVFILTTPNYKELNKDLDNPSAQALLSPGAHTVLFSEESLRHILSETGFKYISVKRSGNSLIAVSSFQEKKWKKWENRNELVRNYYTKVLKKVAGNSLAYIGILFRLFRNYVDFGDYHKANSLLKEYTFPVLPSVSEIERIDSLENYTQFGASCNSLLAYYIGIMRLNYYRDFEIAASYFNISYLLSKKKLALMAHDAVLEFDIIWLAKYHSALSFFSAGIYNMVLQETKEIMDFKHLPENPFIPMPDKNILKKAKDLYNQTPRKL